MASIRILALPALLLMLALPLAAQARSLDAPKAPPTEPVYEVDPGDRQGYTRVLGHWEWTGERFMWSPGNWVADKEGYVWVADSWAQRGKKWHLTPGHYEPDGSAPAPAEVVETHAERVDVSPEEPKEIVEPSASRSEMDDVEGRVLSPQKKPALAEKTNPAPKHKGKHTVVKKQPDYNDPKQYPFYHRH